VNTLLLIDLDSFAPTVHIGHCILLFVLVGTKADKWSSEWCSAWHRSGW